MHLAIFDLDHTLLAGDSDYLWGQFMVERGLVDASHYARENQRFFDQYRAGTLDIAEYCSFALEPLTTLEFAVLDDLRRQFVASQIAPIVAPQAPALLARHRAQGDRLVITTATNRFVTEPIAALLGVEDLIATEPEQRDGRFTGRVKGIANFQAGKVTRLQQWLDAQRLQPQHLTCYSDSRNDLPLLDFAHQAVAVDPDPVLAGIAQQRGWPVISLRGPALALIEPGTARQAGG